MLLAPAVMAAEEPREIVRRAVEASAAHDKAAVDWGFVERQDIRQIDSNGRTKKHEIRTFDVVIAEGTPYRRLIEREDQPLSAEEDRHEREKQEWGIQQRRAETPEQRAKRIADWDKKRNRQREFLKELPDAFVFKILREETAGGRAVWVIDAQPRPGYQPGSMAAGFLRKMRGTMWIDKQDYGWARLEAEAFDNVAIGLFLARMHKGSRVSIEQMRVADGVWLPKRMDIAASLRVALVKWVGGEWRYRYRDYRRLPAAAEARGMRE